MDIGLKSTQDVFHVRLLEDGDVIDKGEGSDDPSSFVLFENGPAFSLQFSDRAVAVEGYYQNISLFFRLF